MLLSGHTYEVGFSASSQANTGMTSFRGEFTIVPEPACLALAAAALLLPLRRR